MFPYQLLTSSPVSSLLMALVSATIAAGLEGIASSGGWYYRQTICPGQVIQMTHCSKTVQASTRSGCGAVCRQDGGCVGFLRNPATQECHLCTTVTAADCSNTEATTTLESFEQIFCQNGGSAAYPGVCICLNGIRGARCEQRMTDCNDWKAAGYGDGVYWVIPTLSAEGFQMLCEMEWGRSFIMDRNDSSVDFYRNWAEYRGGFGDVAGNHWLGLQKIYELTNSRNYDLLVEIHMKDLSWKQQYFKTFKVSSEAQLYTLDFVNSGSYQNYLGDSLTDVKGKPFSTYDVDNDGDGSVNCAEIHHSGWWFFGSTCTLCNPTGILVQPADMQRTGDPQEVFWTNNLQNTAPHAIRMWLQRP